MFIHQQKLQYNSRPEKPDAVYARKLQEVIGGQYGEIGYVNFIRPRDDGPTWPHLALDQR